VPENFDAKMSALAVNTTVHLGPGTFSTTGYEGWTAVSGIRILGGGVDATTLKVSGALVPLSVDKISAPQRIPSLDGHPGPSSAFWRNSLLYVGEPLS